MTLGVVLDIVVAVLLIAAIGSAFMLNRRFAAFREAKAEFEQVIERFNLAAGRAENGVAGLRTGADAVGSSLQQTIHKAQAVRADLVALIERAEANAAAIDLAARVSAAVEEPKPAPQPMDAVRPLRAVRPVAAASAAAPAEAAAAPVGLLKSLSSLR